MNFTEGYRLAVERVREQNQRTPDSHTQQALELIERGDYRAASELIKGLLHERQQGNLYRAAFYHVACTLYETLHRESHTEDSEASQGCACRDGR